MPDLKQLNGLRKQLSEVTDKIDLSDLTDKIDLDKLGLTERKKVLGIPTGGKQTDWSKIASYGATAIAAIAGSRLLSRGKAKSGDQGSNGSGGADDSDGKIKSKAKELKGKGEELKEKGEEKVDTVTDLKDKAEDVQEATAEASTPVGKAMKAAQALSGDDGPTKKQRLIIQEQIDIAVPRRIVYDQWTQFAEMAERSRAVKNVDQEDDENTSWQAKMLFSTRNWDAEIVQQVPDRRIVWESSGDVDHRGVVTFHELAEDLTRVQVEMEYHPTGLVEKVGNLFLTVRHRVRKDLRLFRHHLELEAEATGGWRGQIGDDIEVPEGDEDDAAAASSDDAAGSDVPDADDGASPKQKVIAAFENAAGDAEGEDDDEDDPEG
jgi:uncharacterized membrane protein